MPPGRFMVLPAVTANLDAQDFAVLTARLMMLGLSRD